MCKLVAYFERRLFASPPIIPLSFLSLSFGIVVCFSSNSIVFGNMCPRRKLHKLIACIWIVLVMRGHIATRIRFYDLHLGPYYEDRHAFGLTIKGVQLVLEVALI